MGAFCAGRSSPAMATAVEPADAPDGLSAIMW